MIDIESKGFLALKEKVKTLDSHYEATNATLETDQKRKHYGDQIKELKSLLKNAETGSISAASLNKLVQAVDKSMKDITPPEELKPSSPTFRT